MPKLGAVYIANALVGCRTQWTASFLHSFTPPRTVKAGASFFVFLASLRPGYRQQHRRKQQTQRADGGCQGAGNAGAHVDEQRAPRLSARPRARLLAGSLVLLSYFCPYYEREGRKRLPCNRANNWEKSEQTRRKNNRRRERDTHEESCGECSEQYYEAKTGRATPETSGGRGRYAGEEGHRPVIRKDYVLAGYGGKSCAAVRTEPLAEMTTDAETWPEARTRHIM